MTTEDIVTALLLREGREYTNDPIDHGGPTKFGITLRDLRAWRSRIAADEGEACHIRLATTEADVEALEEAEAREIYRRRYILDPGFDQIPDDWLRAFVVDTGVLQGQKTAVKLVQRALGVTMDGILGPVTLAALAAADPALIRSIMIRNRIQHLVACALADVPPDTVSTTNLKFLRGWLNRVAAFL